MTKIAKKKPIDIEKIAFLIDILPASRICPESRSTPIFSSINGGQGNGVIPHDTLIQNFI